MYHDWVCHAVQQRDVERWGKMGKDGGGKMGLKSKNGERLGEMGKLGGGKMGLGIDLGICYFLFPIVLCFAQ